MLVVSRRPERLAEWRGRGGVLDLRCREVARAGLKRCILVAVFEAREEPCLVLSNRTTEGGAILFSVEWRCGKRTVECRRQGLQVSIALVKEERTMIFICPGLGDDVDNAVA